MRIVRARMQLGRGNLEGALADSERGLERAREAKNPLSLRPAMFVRAHVQYAAGERDETLALLDELLIDAARPERRLPFHGPPDVPWLYQTMGREAEWLAAQQLVPRVPWVVAAEAILARDYVRAADVYEELLTLPSEAFARQRAAEALVAEGRRAEADVQLHRALALWRSMGATAYAAQCEALLADSA